jgi:hypothetical protein
MVWNGQFSRRHIARRLTRVASVVVVAALFLPGCGSDAPTTPSDTSGRTFTTTAGQELEIRLQNIGPGEYGVPPAISSPVVRFQGVSLGDPVPAGLTQLFRFQAVRAGRALVTFRHSEQPKTVIDTIIVQ